MEIYFQDQIADIINLFLKNFKRLYLDKNIQEWNLPDDDILIFKFFANALAAACHGSPK